MKERYHKQRWIIRRAQHVNVVSHFLECGNAACTRPAVIYRPHQEDAPALRGYSFGLDVVARMGELRYRHNLSMIKMREQLQTEAKLMISLKEVALLCEVFLAWVTAVVPQAAELITQLRPVDGIVLAIDGVQAEKRHETLSLVRDVRSGRVWLAQTRLSSATAEIEPLIEDVRRLGLPIVGVISDKQESICFAVRHKLPTVPHQIGQYHYLKDVAQPICDADRPVKKELKKKIRGIRELERHAETSPSQDAQMVADDCLAMRTVLRDHGKYPLDPPGVQLDQQWQLIAAAGERVRVVHPSVLLKKLSRMPSVLNVVPKAYEQLVILFSWVYQIAQRLTAQTSCEEAQARLLTLMHELHHSGLPTELLRVMTYVEKITVAFAPQLFEYVKQPLLPRTHNDLELCIGRLKQSRRHLTGRKNTQACILREGTFVAILLGLPQPDRWVEACSRVNPQDFHRHLHRVRQLDTRRKCWHVRRDLPASRIAWERPWVPQEVVLQR